MRRLPHQLEKVSLPYGAREFAAGVDPFGIWSTGLGMKNEAQGRSHGVGTAASVVGGLLGGGVLLPSAITGTTDGVSALSRGRSLGEAARAAQVGVVSPWRRIAKARRVQDAFSRGELLGGIREMSRSSGPPSAGSGGAGIGQTLQAVNRLRQMSRFDEIRRHGASKALSRSIGRSLRTAYVGLGIGAGVGAVGAAVQYNKGVGIERNVAERVRGGKGG